MITTVDNFLISDILKSETPLFKNLQKSDNYIVTQNHESIAFLTSLLFFDNKKKKNIILLADNDNSATYLYENIFEATNGQSVQLITNLYKEKDLKSLNEIGVENRWRAIQQIDKNEPSIFVVSADALFFYIPTVNKLLGGILRLFGGMEINHRKLKEKLIAMGYESASQVENTGEFSVRGDIVDIFSLGNDYPIRIEFWGDEIESIRFFDLMNQKSIEKIKEINILPFNDSVSNNNNTNNDYIENFANYNHFLLELFDDKNTTVLLQDTISFGANFAYLTENFSEDYLYHPNDIKKKILKFENICFTINSNHNSLIDFSSKEAEVFYLDNLSKLLSNQENISNGNNVSDRDEISFVGADDRIINEARKLDVNNRIKSFYKGDIPQSFFLTDTNGKKRILFSGRTFEKREFSNLKNKKNKRFEPINYNSLKPGDFVVHEDHGIGVFLHIEQITVGDNIQDCFVIEYQSKDKVFVPLQDFYKITKYSVHDGSNPSVDKLGGKRWTGVKNALNEKFKKMSEELLITYAKRTLHKREPIEIDKNMLFDFENAFPYMLTKDQKASIDALYDDLNRPYYMDRLVCGDVGFGKTEVAVRSAFYSALQSKQVAVIVPTTILAKQHYYSFLDRMRNFPVKIEYFSRHTSAKEATRIKKALLDGSCDIVIGTHKLLGSAIRFKDLGMVIIDEEQRFGVAHKNKLVQYRSNIDILSLSATPIPRTMNMALGGVKDLSTIMTPPKDRLPVETQIKIYDLGFIKEAIEQELTRDGQVFLIHNRINDIVDFSAKLKQVMPKVRFAVAHGQMSGNEMEDTIEEFIEKKHDVLISTTIIENGIDMSSVNTIIIDNAQNFGLGQLYQLRGRVGRSDRQAYCYLIVPTKGHLTGDVKARLTTLTHYTELGSGYNIAMRDLEIRGAGDILGKEQSGELMKVGFSLYFRMLHEMIDKVKGNKFISPHQVDFEVASSIYISEDYIEDDEVRATIYHRLSNCITLAEIDDIEDEIKDRFGRLDDYAYNLLRAIESRILAGQKGITGFKLLSSDELIIRWDDIAKINAEEMMKKLSNIKNEFLINYESGFTISFILRNSYKDKKIWQEIRDILDCL